MFDNIRANRTTRRASFASSNATLRTETDSAPTGLVPRVTIAPTQLTPRTVSSRSTVYPIGRVRAS